MKVSDLLQIRDSIRNAYKTDSLVTALQDLKHKISVIETNSEEPVFKSELRDILSVFNRIEACLSDGERRYNNILAHIAEDVEKESHKFFTDNYRLELQRNEEAISTIRKGRILEMKDEAVDEVRGKLQMYTDWHYPALEIGCRDGEWTKYMVAADPLYIVDYYQEFLDSAASQFHEQYQNRLRRYLCADGDFSALPQGQFGFVFCWNLLNYRSLDTVKEYLKNVLQLLRPGGVFMFSYNDGDRPAGAAMAENYYMSYIPRPLLIPLCESLGYEIIVQRTRDLSLSWIELKKPGVLKTVKAHQVLGEIWPITNLT